MPPLWRQWSVNFHNNIVGWLIFVAVWLRTGKAECWEGVYNPYYDCQWDNGNCGLTVCFDSVRALWIIDLRILCLHKATLLTVLLFLSYYFWRSFRWYFFIRLTCVALCRLCNYNEFDTITKNNSVREMNVVTTTVPHPLFQQKLMVIPKNVELTFVRCGTYSGNKTLDAKSFKISNGFKIPYPFLALILC